MSWLDRLVESDVPYMEKHMRPLRVIFWVGMAILLIMIVTAIVNEWHIAHAQEPAPQAQIHQTTIGPAPIPLRRPKDTLPSGREVTVFGALVFLCICLGLTMRSRRRISKRDYITLRSNRSRD